MLSFCNLVKNLHLTLNSNKNKNIIAHILTNVAATCHPKGLKEEEPTLAETWLLEDGDTGYNNACDLQANDIIDSDDLGLFIDKWLD